MKDNNRLKLNSIIIIVFIAIITTFSVGYSAMSSSVSISGEMSLVSATGSTPCTFTGTLEQGASYTNGKYSYRFMQEYVNGTWVDVPTFGWGAHQDTVGGTGTLCSSINNYGIISTVTPTARTLSINNHSVTTVTISRTSSFYTDVTTGVITSSDAIYDGDVLVISASLNTGYQDLVLKVNNSNFTSGGSHTVAANVSVDANATIMSFTQTVEGRYQNADGTYGSYTTLTTATKNYGETMSYTRAQDDTYQAVSITSYTVTSAQTTQIDVPRRTSTNAIQFRLQAADGTYPSTYTSGVSGTYRVGQTVSWSRAQDDTYVAASQSFVATASNQTKSVDVARRTSTNIIQVRYQNGDGTYGSYSNVVNASYRVGQTVSWSRAQDATYNAGSSSFTATATNQTKQVSITRRTYALTVSKGTCIGSVSGGGTYRVGQVVSISATAASNCTFQSWSRTAGVGTIANTGSASTTFTMSTGTATVTATGKTSNITFYFHVTILPKSGGTIDWTLRGVGPAGYTIAQHANNGQTTWTVTAYSNTNNSWTAPFTPTVTSNGTTITVKNGNSQMFSGSGAAGTGGSWNASNVPTNNQWFTYYKDYGT